MPDLTQELVERCLEVSRAEVEKAIADDDSGGPERLHLLVPALLAVTAWKVLVPFLVSVSAGVASAAITARWIREQSVKGLKEMLQERMGQRIRIDDTRIEESVLLIEEVLKPFGVDRDKARRIVDVLVSTVSEQQKRDVPSASAG